MSAIWAVDSEKKTFMLYLRSDHFISGGGGGGGGLRKMYLNNLFIFSQFRSNFFILPAVKNKLFVLESFGFCV